ncbi:MAG: glycerol-3-phosphate cytidylyltransferase [Epsilonproteobacteria bacterium]|nr:glycerol-3-phosphate cytidylyltransferase [Campylobacterota bacterium]NPA89814.1 glycerol-3-phosphate cytidylyltransferase [Campylobacterota bacterium]
MEGEKREGEKRGGAQKGGKTIITYGTFDLFHIGHLRLLQRAKALGDRLIVGVSTDQFNAQKGKKSIIPFEHRKEIVANIKGVDLVIPENSWEQKVEDIKKYGVDIFVMGSDWKGKFDYLKKYCQVVYLERTTGISSTQLRNILTTISVSKEEIVKAFEILEQLKRDLL